MHDAPTRQCAGLWKDRAEAVALRDKLDAEGIETLRMVFADPHGVLRGKTLTLSALPGAVTGGLRVPSTLLLKDLSHRTVFPVWSRDGDAPMHGAGDILLVPDMSSCRTLPHSPHSALVRCDVADVAGAQIPFDARTILSKAVDDLADAGLRSVMGLEVEFQIHAMTDPALTHEQATMPGRAPETRPLNQGYQFLTETRYDAMEDILDDLRRAAQAMGLPVLSVEVEMGPGQVEFTFAAADPLTIADRAVVFRTLARELCQRRGLLASFMPKPRLPNAAANGWHIHQSVTDAHGRNLMTSESHDLSPTASGWIAGLLEHAVAGCLATNPTVNSYKRFSAYQLAPNRVGWGIDNRGAMLRSLCGPGRADSRVENRLADSSANPYLALALQIHAGLDGLRRDLSAPPALTDPYDDSAPDLPVNLGEAVAAFAGSDMFTSALGSDVAGFLTRLKTAEWERYNATITDWEQDEYFDAF